jgi:ribosomal protein S12 methylthiotransferase
MTSLPSLPILAADVLPTRLPTARRDAPAGTSKGRYALVSLGCPKNLVDTERMLGRLQSDGYSLVSDPVGADFVVVNTCGFIDAARQESLAAIDEMLELKRRGGVGGVVVAGCLAERQREALFEARPEIDHLVGVFGREEIERVADRLFRRQEEQRTVFRPAPSRPLPDTGRFRVTPRHYAYLKISEGCDRLCTFCAIPRMRGKHATKPIEEVLDEARELAADGVRELIIVAQDTTYYGMDLYGEPRLVELLDGLEQIEGIEWIRLMYLYPMYFSDELVEWIASSRRIVPYLDLPLQHISDPILKRMQRRVNRAETENLLGKLRSSIDNLTLRTTFITGFPGETDDQFEELCEFVTEQRFERLGVFTYSYEPDTPAARLGGHLQDEVKVERRDRLMELQQSIAFEVGDARVDQRMDVIIDVHVPGEEGAWVGRTAADAPDVDSVVYVTGENLSAGSLVECEIVARQDYDLIAAAVGAAR